MDSDRLTSAVTMARLTLSLADAGCGQLRRLCAQLEVPYSRKTPHSELAKALAEKSQKLARSAFDKNPGGHEWDEFLVVWLDENLLYSAVRRELRPMQE